MIHSVIYDMPMEVPQITNCYTTCWGNTIGMKVSLGLWHDVDKELGQKIPDLPEVSM